MRVLLADDHRLLVEGLQNLLEAHGIEVVGVARDGLEAAAKARELRPEIILMDVRMPVCDGLAATRLIKSDLPEIKIVMLTTSSDDDDLFEAVKSGAGGYLLKSMDADSLIEALDDAYRDTPPFAPGLAAKLLAEFVRTAAPVDQVTPAAARAGATEQPAPEQPARVDALTARQLEVLALIAEGLSYKEVGRRTCLSPRTVKYHMAEIIRKLHAQNRAQVLAYAGRMAKSGEAEPRR
jgi:DNA-binding NarL/FixJ family response regulator